MRGGYGLHTGTPMSCAEGGRRFWERLKAAKARSVNDPNSVKTFTSDAEPAYKQNQSQILNEILFMYLPNLFSVRLYEYI